MNNSILSNISEDMNVTDRQHDLKVVYYAPKDIRVEPQNAVLSIKPGEVLIKVEACAICGSDIKTYLNGNPRMNPPNTIGHEFCGTIIDSGIDAQNKGYRIGLRYTMATSIGCGECSFCKEGKSNICSNIKAMGFHCDGAMASKVIIPERAVDAGQLVPIGDLEPEIAALSEPMSCAVNSLSRIDKNKIHSALVIGIGALGIFHAIILRDWGVKNIVCVSDPGTKRDAMEALGFCVIGRKELDTKYKDLSSGEGFDLVVITAPSNQVQSNALKYARKGGYISYFASLPTGNEMITINSRLLHYNELVLYGTSDSTPAYVMDAVKILNSNKSLIQQVITKLPLMDFQDGVKGILDKRYMKVVLIP